MGRSPKMREAYNAYHILAYLSGIRTNLGLLISSANYAKEQKNVLEFRGTFRIVSKVLESSRKFF